MNIINDHSRAVSYYKKALEINIKHVKNPSLITTSGIYFGLALEYKKNNEEKKSIEYIDKYKNLVFSQLKQDINEKKAKETAFLLYSFGSNLLRYGDYETSLKSLEYALKIYNNSNDKFYISLINSIIGQIYQELGDYKKSESYLLSAIDYEKDQKDPLMLIGYYYLL